MKKVLMIFMLALGAIICQSCNDETYEQRAARLKEQGNLLPESTFEYSPLNTYKVIKIGNCEYIAGWGGQGNGGPYLTHKGDCSNPIHKFMNSDSLKK